MESPGKAIGLPFVAAVQYIPEQAEASHVVEGSSQNYRRPKGFSGNKMLGVRESPNMTNGHKNEKFNPKPHKSQNWKNRNRRSKTS
jgi:hypothetical protein